MGRKNILRPTRLHLKMKKHPFPTKNGKRLLIKTQEVDRIGAPDQSDVRGFFSFTLIGFLVVTSVLYFRTKRDDAFADIRTLYYKNSAVALGDHPFSQLMRIDSALAQLPRLSHLKTFEVTTVREKKNALGNIVGVCAKYNAGTPLEQVFSFGESCFSIAARPNNRPHDKPNGRASLSTPAHPF